MLRDRIHHLGANVVWLIVNRAVRLILGLVVLGYVSRYLGPKQFGVLNYAILLSTLFAAVAGLGLDGIVIRELVRLPGETDRILGTAFVLKLCGAVVAMGLVLATVVATRAVEVPWYLCVIVASTFLPQSFDVIDLWFQKNVQSKYTVCAAIITALLGAGIKLGLVYVRAPIALFAAAMAGDAVLNAVGLIVVYRVRGQGLTSWRSRSATARTLLLMSWPLILSGLLVTVYQRIEQILVVNLLGMHTAGVYFAAVRVAEIWNFLPVIILGTIYPILVEKHRQDPVAFQGKLQSVFDVLTGMGFVVSLVVSLLSSQIILFIYGPQFIEAAGVLAIQAWSAPITFSGAVRSQYFVIENLNVFHIPAALLGIACNVAIALWLIPTYGAIGAALGSLGGYWVAGYLSSLLFADLHSCARCQTRAFLLPIRLPRIIRTLLGRA